MIISQIMRKKNSPTKKKMLIFFFLLHTNFSEKIHRQFFNELLCAKVEIGEFPLIACNISIKIHFSHGERFYLPILCVCIYSLEFVQFNDTVCSNVLVRTFVYA